jgi:dTDP-4-dehydrorhamnose reductase
MKKVVVIGADGQLGSDLVLHFKKNYEVTGLTYNDLDIVKMDDAWKLLKQINPNIILNTAAYHNVPLCEENPLISFEVNAIGALNLARISEDIDAALVHYSTDYVFDGLKNQPYIETDQTNPLNVYALTKRDGEILIQNNWHKNYIIRISGIYGAVPCMAKGGNFITTMKKVSKEKDVVRVVQDEILTPTSVTEIAQNTDHLVSNGTFGLYHMTCEGACSWYEFARAIFDLLELKTPLEPCTVDEFPSPVKRPFYSVLENKNLKAQKLNIMKPWRDALHIFLKEN